MADSLSTKPAPGTKRPTLLPQAEHAGKPAMPLGAHLFTLIGSRNRAHLHLLSNTISRNHACIITGKSGVYVRDLASRAGVIVNTRKVKESELQDGDLVQFGSFKFKFQEPPGPIRLATGPRTPLAMLEMDARALTPMDERTILIGRRPGCDITLDSSAVSNTHAVIFECDGKRYVRDLGSRTGTIVNGSAVHQHALEIGDQIRIGTTTLRYIAADMPAIDAEETEHALPLETESAQAAAHEERHAAVGLHFDDAAAAEALESDALEPLPLDEAESQLPVAATESEPEQPSFVAPHAEPADEIDFATDHAVEPAAEVPVEEELPLVQHDVTAPAAAIADPAEDQGIDFWTPPAEQESALAAPPVSIQAEEPEFKAESHVPELTADPEMAHHEAPAEEPLEVIPELEPLPELDELEPVAAEPELTMLEPAASAVEPELAEPIEAAPVDESTHDAIAEPQIDHAPAPIEEPLAPLAVESQDEETAPAVDLASATPEAEGGLSITAAPDLETAPTLDSSESAPTLSEEPEVIEPSVDLHAAPAEDAAATSLEASPEPEGEAPAAESEHSVASPADLAIEAEPVASEAPVASEEPVASDEPAAPETESAIAPEPAPTAIEDVDLSAVDFQSEPSTSDIPAEAAVEPPTEPAPLLDLLPTPADETAAPPADVIEPPMGKRAGRGSRRKQAAPRTPRKKKVDRLRDEMAQQVASGQAEVTEAAEPIAAETEVAETVGATASSDGGDVVASDSAMTPIEPTVSHTESAAVEPTDAAVSEEPSLASMESTPADASIEESQAADVSQPDRSMTLSPPVELESTPELAVPEEIASDDTQNEIPVVTEAEIDASPEAVQHAESDAPAAPDRLSTTELEDELGITTLEPASEMDSAPAADAIASHTDDFGQQAHAEPPVTQASDAPSGPSSLWKAAMEASLEETGTATPPPSDTFTAPVDELPEPEVANTSWTESLDTTPLELGDPIEPIASTTEIGAASTPPPVEAIPPIETIAETEPTLESALDLEPSLEADGALDDAAALEPSAAPFSSLSDTAFDAIVADFAGEESLPLVEDAGHAPAASLAHADEPAAPAAEPESTQSEAAQTLESLDDVELPPLELGDSLPFSAEEPVAAPADQNLTVNEPITESIGEVSSTALPADTGFTTSETLAPTLDLTTEDNGLDFQSPAVETPSFDAGLEWEEPAGLVPEIDSSGLDFEDSPASMPQATEGTAFDAALREIDMPVARDPVMPSTPAEIRAESPANPAAPAPPPRNPMNPFFGMERDLGTFIGGMPLSFAPIPPQTAVAATAPLAPLQSQIPAPAARSPEAGEPAATPSASDETLTFDEPAGAEVDLDKLFEGEEPLELFDETADQLDSLPDSLDPINDVGGVIGEAQDTKAAAPPEPVRSVAPAAPLRSLTADPSTAQPKPPTTTVNVPPFSGARPVGRPGGNPFAGLAGIRTTDVFSQTAFPSAEAPTFQAQPIDNVPPMTPSKPPGRPAGSPPGFGASGPSPKGDGNTFSAPPPPAHRPVAPRPTAAQISGQMHDHRPWWKNIRVLLPLLVLLIVAAVVVIIRFFPPKTLVQGTLQIKGVDDRDLGVYARADQIKAIRESIKDWTLRQMVLQRLHNEGVATGFTEDTSAFDQLAAPANSPFENNRMVLQRTQTDPDDAKRMDAIIQALYLSNQTAAEQTSHLRDEAAIAIQKVKALDAKLAAQRDDLRQKSNQIKTNGGGQAAEMLANPAIAVETLQQQNSDLRKALAQANADVSRKHEDWESAQASARQGPDTDPKLMQIRQKLASLSAQLTVARAAAGGHVDPAAAFGDAILAVDRDLTPIASAGTKDPALSAYLGAARLAASDIRNLLDLQKQDSDRIAELQQQLAGHREAHLRQVWAADETLKGLLEERDAQAHRFGTASDSGLTQDAAHIRAVLDDLDQKIEARRQSLATTGQASDELQQNLEQTIEHLRSDRHDNDEKIVAALGRLEIPPVGKLPPDDEQLLQQMNVGQDVAAAAAAHEQYASGAKPTAANAEAQVRKLEADIAEQQAQLDAYEQRADAKAAVATARKALDAAQDAEAKAQAAYAANVNVLINARQVKDAQSQANDLTSERDAAARDAQAKAAQAAATPILLPPDPQNAVRVISQGDQRVWYLAGAIGLIVLLFAGPLWMAVRTPPADLPFAAIQNRREPVIEAGSHHDDDELPLMDDDEHPALT